MTQQFAIASRDHREAVSDKIHRREALRRILPVVAPDGFESEDHLGDLLLACANAMPIHCLQHTPCAGQLLTRKARVGRNGAAMKGGQQPREGFHSIKPVHPERNHRHERFAGRCASGHRQVHALPVAEFMQEVKSVLGILVGKPGWQRERRTIREGRRRGRQYHRSGVFLRKPKHVCLGRLQSGCDKEIATPSGDPPPHS